LGGRKKGRGKGGRAPPSSGSAARANSILVLMISTSDQEDNREGEREGGKMHNKKREGGRKGSFFRRRAFQIHVYCLFLKSSHSAGPLRKRKETRGEGGRKQKGARICSFREAAFGTPGRLEREVGKKGGRRTGALQFIVLASFLHANRYPTSL